jgi:hypothetical protein
MWRRFRVRVTNSMDAPHIPVRCPTIPTRNLRGTVRCLWPAWRQTTQFLKQIRKLTTCGLRAYGQSHRSAHRLTWAFTNTAPCREEVRHIKASPDASDFRCLPMPSRNMRSLTLLTKMCVPTALAAIFAVATFSAATAVAAVSTELGPAPRPALKGYVDTRDVAGFDLPHAAVRAAPGTCRNAHEVELCELINDYRVTSGLRALPISKALSTVAQYHACKSPCARHCLAIVFCNVSQPCSDGKICGFPFVSQGILLRMHLTRPRSATCTLGATNAQLCGSLFATLRTTDKHLGCKCDVFDAQESRQIALRPSISLT